MSKKTVKGTLQLAEDGCFEFKPDGGTLAKSVSTHEGRVRIEPDRLRFIASKPLPVDRFKPVVTTPTTSVKLIVTRNMVKKETSLLRSELFGEVTWGDVLNALCEHDSVAVATLLREKKKQKFNVVTW